MRGVSRWISSRCARGELLESAGAERGQAQADDPAVPRVLVPLHQPRLLRPVDQPHRAVVAQQQVARDVADGGARLPFVSADGEQELVLGRRQSRPFGLLFAPVQEAAQADPELEQPPDSRRHPDRES